MPYDVLRRHLYNLGETTISDKKNFKKKFLIKKKITKTFFFFVPQFRILFSGIPQKVEKNLKFRFLGRKMDFPLFRSFHIPQKSKNIPWNSARGIRFLVPTIDY